MRLNGVECDLYGTFSDNDCIKLQFKDLVTGRGMIHTIELTGEEVSNLMGAMEQFFQRWAKEQWYINSTN